jgi:hypothetical protein
MVRKFRLKFPVLQKAVSPHAKCASEIFSNTPQ